VNGDADDVRELLEEVVDDERWRIIELVAVETLLRTVHDLGVPTQARVDAAAALLQAAQSRQGVS